MNIPWLKYTIWQYTNRYITEWLCLVCELSETCQRSRCSICNDDNFIASRFSNSQIIVCNVHTAIIEEVFPACSAKSTCLTASPLTTSNLWPFCSNGIHLTLLVVYLFLWYLLSWHYSRIFQSLTICIHPIVPKRYWCLNWSQKHSVHW